MYLFCNSTKKKVGYLFHKNTPTVLTKPLVEIAEHLVNNGKIKHLVLLYTLMFLN